MGGEIEQYLISVVAFQPYDGEGAQTMANGWRYTRQDLVNPGCSLETPT